jgi:hypothetical protein
MFQDLHAAVVVSVECHLKLEDLSAVISLYKRVAHRLKVERDAILSIIKESFHGAGSIDQDQGLNKVDLALAVALALAIAAV